MTFNTTKCKVLILNGAFNEGRFTLNEEVLDVVTTYKYLGVTLTTNYVTNLFKNHFQSILKRAKIRAAAIRCLGFSKNGFRVKTSIRLYKLLVRPILEFSAQSLAHAPYRQPFRKHFLCGFAKTLEPPTNPNTEITY